MTDTLKELGRMDIYLIDQLMKHRVDPSMKIFDAGCGGGRNSEYFIRHGYDICGVDLNPDAIASIHEQISIWNPSFEQKRFQQADLASTPYANDQFDFIISSAVMHFASHREHFEELFGEMMRVLKPGGTLFMRMTTKHTLLHLSHQVQGDVYHIPDGSTRYLLDRDHLKVLMEKYQLEFVDPFKTVNVSDFRTMSVVVLRKVA